MVPKSCISIKLWGLLNKMEDTEAKEKYYTLKVLYENIEEYEKYLQQLQERMQSLTKALDATEKLKNVQSNSDILIPISSGIFVKGNITNTKDLLMNVGSGVVVNKDVDATQKVLRSQVMELEKMHHDALQELEKFVMQARIIEQEVEQGQG